MWWQWWQMRNSFGVWGHNRSTRSLYFLQTWTGKNLVTVKLYLWAYVVRFPCCSLLIYIHKKTSPYVDGLIGVYCFPPLLQSSRYFCSVLTSWRSFTYAAWIGMMFTPDNEKETWILWRFDFNSECDEISKWRFGFVFTEILAFFISQNCVATRDF